MQQPTITPWPVEDLTGKELEEEVRGTIGRLVDLVVELAVRHGRDMEIDRRKSREADDR